MIKDLDTYSEVSKRAGWQHAALCKCPRHAKIPFCSPGAIPLASV